MAGRQLIGVSLEGDAAVLTFRRREKLNALSSALETELLAALETSEVAASRCIIFNGEGGVFSAGADVNEMRGREPADIMRDYHATGQLHERVADLPQVTMSAISGFCLGGGLELALATDFRIADETAMFGFPEVAIGILPSSGGTHRLARLVGPALAKDLMLLRLRFSAAEALEFGIVREVVEEGRTLERALELAAALAQLPRLAVSITKQAADRMAEGSREAGIFIEQLAYAMLAQTDDAREAADAFAEKRPPRFTGR